MQGICQQGESFARSIRNNVGRALVPTWRTAAFACSCASGLPVVAEAISQLLNGFP